MSDAIDLNRTDVLEAANFGTSGTIDYKTAEKVWKRYNPGQTPTHADILRTMAEVDAIAYNLRHPKRNPVKPDNSPMIPVPSAGRQGRTTGARVLDMRTVTNRTSESFQAFLRNQGPTPPTPPIARDRRQSGAKPPAGEVIVRNVDDPYIRPPMPTKRAKRS